MSTRYFTCKFYPANQDLGQPLTIITPRQTSFLQMSVTLTAAEVRALRELLNDWDEETGTLRKEGGDCG